MLYAINRLRIRDSFMPCVLLSLAPNDEASIGIGMAVEARGNGVSRWVFVGTIASDVPELESFASGHFGITDAALRAETGVDVSCYGK